jgi:hypothetical protein
MADLLISNQSWNSIDASAQARIKEILVDCKLLGPADSIAYDPAASATAFAIPDSVCKAACVAAEAVAVGACALLPVPDSLVCIAAARAAGELCKSACTARTKSPPTP